MKTGVRFLSAGSYLPESTLTNEDIASRLNLSIQPAWVVDSLGIEQRRIAGAGELTSDLASKAVASALRNAGVSSDSIDLLVLATSSPDMRAPSTACIVQAKAGLDQAVAFDKVGSIAVGG